jgi:hypothetical protein
MVEIYVQVNICWRIMWEWGRGVLECWSTGVLERGAELTWW